MYELSRRVRFGLRPGDLHGEPTPAAVDALDGMGVFQELEVLCAGPPDAVTGYLLNISVIDRAVRTHAIHRIARAMADWNRDPAAGRPRPEQVLSEVIAALQPALGRRVEAVRWWPSPYHWLRCEARAMDRVQLSQQFEFAAAHRLHCPELTEDRNREVFGKCNNPSGHGHNYRLEAAVSVPTGPGPRRFGFRDLARLVDEHVTSRFDHKHLNLDTAEFAHLNPSVEHIARVCHDLLSGPVAEAGGRLDYVTVWETEKTACTYPAVTRAAPPSRESDNTMERATTP